MDELRTKRPIYKYLVIFLALICLFAAGFYLFGYGDKVNNSSSNKENILVINGKGDKDNGSNQGIFKNCFLPRYSESEYQTKKDSTWKSGGWSGVNLMYPDGYKVESKGSKDGVNTYVMYDQNSWHEAVIKQIYISDQQIKINSISFPQTTYEYQSDTWWQGKDFSSDTDKVICNPDAWSYTDQGVPVYYVNDSDGGYSGSSYYILFDPRDFSNIKEDLKPILLKISVMTSSESDNFVSTLEAIIKTVEFSK